MRKFKYLTLLAFIALAFPIKVAVAQPVVADQPCDPQFFRQMQSRAWLESEREIMQNQNLIFKADSVLEYTCFDQFANIAAHRGGEIFTHTEYFGGEALIPRGDPFALEVALEEILIAGGGGLGSLISYQLENFEHPLLGGWGILDSSRVEPPFHEFESMLAPRAYECNVMERVWHRAKCLNFINGPEDEYAIGTAYHPLETLECGPDDPNCAEPVLGYDDPNIRVHIRSMAGQCGLSTGLHDWGEELITAENRTEDLYLYQTPLAVIFEDVALRTDPGACTPPIETGVQIILSTGPTGTQDAVCSNPGCTYDGGRCI